MNRMKNCFLVFLLALGSFPGHAQETSKKEVNTDRAPAAIGPYSQGIRVGHTVYLSGQIAIDPETGLMDTLTIENEVRRIMKNIGMVLRAEGLDYTHIVKTTIYATDLDNYGIINQVYSTYLEKPYPARETVQVAALPKGAHVEISVIACDKPAGQPQSSGGLPGTNTP